MPPPSRPRFSRRRPLLLATCALLATAAAAAPAAQPSLEQAVKASFLVKFAPFVEWPPSALGDGRPFVICVAGNDPFGPVLDDVIRGQKIGGRPVAVRRLGAGGNTGNCQMLFAGRSADPGYAPFSNLSGQPVLTVSDSSSGVRGAMIELVMQSGRVRFAIDDSAARANGLVISSKLLGLAVKVDR